MCRRTERVAAGALAVLALLRGARAQGSVPAPTGPGQPPPATAPAPPAPSPSTPAQAVVPSELEEYLEDRGLRELLAVHLLERLKASEGAERTRLADRLGGLYVDLLEHAANADERQRWEARSQDLLKAVPEAESFGVEPKPGKGGDPP